MFNVKAEPIDNVPPYKRIGINDLRAGDPNVLAGPTISIAELIERDRIWDLVKQTASGTCMPISSPSSTSSPTDCDDTVCTDGWEAG